MSRQSFISEYQPVRYVWHGNFAHKVLCHSSYRTDVTDLESLSQAFAQVVKDFGRIDHWYVEYGSGHVYYPSSI